MKKTRSLFEVLPPADNPFVMVDTAPGDGWRCRGGGRTFAYVTNQVSNNVSVIDSATNTVVATVPVGSNPQGVAITPFLKIQVTIRPGTSPLSI